MRTKRGTLQSVKQAAKNVEQRSASNSLLTPEKRTLLPSGCLLFNLACSGTPKGFMETGTIVNLVGDSDAGKTFLAMTALATIFYKFGAAFRYIYLDYERAVSFSIAELFGKPFADALEYYAIPAGPKATIEKWYQRIDTICSMKNAAPAIIVTDSFDALSTLADLANLKKQATKKEGESAGSYGTAKAKAASGFLGKLQQTIADTQSSLIIVSQVRETLAKFCFDKKTRSGGKALRFYSSLEVWLVKTGRLGSNKERPIGGTTKATVKRSRITGKPNRSCEFPLLYAYGLDDTRANLMFLVDEGYVNENKKVLNLSQFNFVGKMKACVEFIEEKPERVKALRRLVIDTWQEIEAKVREEAVGNRKPKFCA